jgi:hypothetical protein
MWRKGGFFSLGVVGGKNLYEILLKRGCERGAGKDGDERKRPANNLNNNKPKLEIN